MTEEMKKILDGIALEVSALLLVKITDPDTWGKGFVENVIGAPPLLEYEQELRKALWHLYIQPILKDPMGNDPLVITYSEKIAYRVTQLVIQKIIAGEGSAPALAQISSPPTIYALNRIAGEEFANLIAAEKVSPVKGPVGGVPSPEPPPEKTLLEEFQDVSGKVEELRQEVKNSHPSMVSSLVVGLGAIAVCLLGGAAAAWVAGRSNSDNGQNKQ